MAINSQGWAQIGMSALSAYTGGAAGVAGAARGGGVFGAPSESSGFSGGIGSGLDSSGWAINFRGNQNATSSPSRVTDYSNGDAQLPAYRQGQPAAQPIADWQGLPFVSSQPQGALASIGSGNTLTWVALGGLALVAIWRLKK